MKHKVAKIYDRAVNIHALYLGGPEFEPQQEDRLSWLRIVITSFTSSRKMLGLYLNLYQPDLSLQSAGADIWISECEI